MRKRPNINGIESIYHIPKKCDNCNIPFFPGDNCIVEPNKGITECFKCGGDTNRPDLLGEWIHHIYSDKKDDNKYYNVSDIGAFERMIGEKIKYET